MIKSKIFGLFKKFFIFCELMGFHITPVHFYFPIPNTKELKDDLWLKYSELVGININENIMIELLSIFMKNFKNEYEKFPRNKTSIPHQYYINNGSFEAVDGEIYYCMIRYFKPKRIIEVGAGFSTFLAAQAILKNREENVDCELIAIEPYPNKVLRKGFPGFSKLIVKKVQDVEISEFKKLKENDILFIDSSHVLHIGSDVKYLYLEVLPRLNKGVLIHCHDIFSPAVSQEMGTKRVKILE